MKGDFTRDTFDPTKHLSRVLMQQGRVQLDADWNEQLDIAAHQAATQATDVIGQTGTPKNAAAFGVVLNPSTLSASDQARVAALGLTPLAVGDFLLTPGRYYIGGTLCEAEDFLSLAKQPDFPGASPITEAGFHLVYLDVWQRHLTALDDDAIREKALGGPDTATRTKTIWRVKTAKVDQAKCLSDPADWAKIVKLSTGLLAARAQPGEATDKPCVLPPGAGYRRLENQLYRVEIHEPGERGKATFKWSRNNGTVVTKVAKAIKPEKIQVDDLGRDNALGFQPGDWVELLDDATELNGVPGVLAQIDTIERGTKTVTFKSAPGFTCEESRHPKMRRWDDPEGAREVKLGVSTNDGFLELEDGVQVKFAEGYYNTGDYWLIPARTAPNGVEWPINPTTKIPTAQPPRGIVHAYCCLAFLTAAKSGTTLTLNDAHDCRDLFIPLTELEDAEEARKRHNRLLHGWGVVCGLQVHCGGDRKNVLIEPGCALQCDGSEVLLPAPGQTFDVVDAAKEADLLKGSTGKVALTITTDARKQIQFGVRAMAATKLSVLAQIMQGTLAMDVYQDCLEPVIQFVRKELFTDDAQDKRFVTEAVRRRTTTTNLFVQFLNTSAGGHVMLSAQEHSLLAKLHDDLKGFLKDPVYCGLLDGLDDFPGYPFRSQGLLTAYGKTPMTEVRVSPDGKLAFAFGAGTATVYVFELAKGEMVAEVELKSPVGVDALAVRDVAFYAKGAQMMVAATAASDSVLFAYKVAKGGASCELMSEPVVVENMQLVRLGQISSDADSLYGLVLGEGLVRFNPDSVRPESLKVITPFNATGHWVLGTGVGASAIFAAAGAEGNAKTNRYTQLLVVTVQGERINVANTIALPASGTDGFGVLFGSSMATNEFLKERTGTRIYVAVDVGAAATAKRVLVFADGGDQVASVALPTTGPVRLAPTASHDFMMVTLAEQYLLGWIDPAKSEWSAAQVLPTQMYPLGLATAVSSTRLATGRQTVKQSLVVVANRDSHTLSVLPAELVSAKPTLPVAAVKEYRARLIALYRALGLRLLQQLKDCFCEHLRRDCPTCDDGDVLELAAIDIREGRVHHICNARRREILTFPKVTYWISAVPVLPALGFLVKEFCCLVVPDLFKTGASGKDLVSAAKLPKIREQVTLARFNQIKAEVLAQSSQVAQQFQKAAQEQVLKQFQALSPVTNQVPTKEFVHSDAEIAKKQLAKRGVEVAEVADYDETVRLTPWRNLADLKFSVQPGERVNLLVKDGKVMMVAKARALEQSSPTDLAGEIERLSTELTRMQDTHTAYVAAREQEMAEMKANVEKFQSLLRAPATPTRRLAPARAKPKKTGQ